MSIQSLTNILHKDAKSLKNKRVLLRLDLNEELSSSGKLLDNFRIQSAIPTINILRSAGAKILIVSHLGRPEGKWDAGLSLKPIATCLAELLGYKYVETDGKLPTYSIPHLVLFKNDITKAESLSFLNDQSAHDIVMLENIRFYEGEDLNSDVFSEQLSKTADLFVNDAFSVCHRAAASVVGITKYLSSSAGPLLEKEIKALEFMLSNKIAKPFVLMMGGIKIADKEQTLRNLGKRADKILLAGGLANLFLKAQGYDVGVDDADKKSMTLAKELLLNFKSKLVLPSDVAVKTIKAPKQPQAKQLSQIVATDKLYDIGPQSILAFSKILKTAGTICWNGPLGYFEDKSFRAGTMAISNVIGGLGKRKAYVLVGGGETVASVRLAGQLEHIDHVSTGGGAMLEFLAGSNLPGIEALKK